MLTIKYVEKILCVYYRMVTKRVLSISTAQGKSILNGIPPNQKVCNFTHYLMMKIIQR